MKMRKIWPVAAAAVMIAAAACSRPAPLHPAAGAEAATLLDIDDRDGYVAVEVSVPWDGGTVVGRYALVPRGTAPQMPADSFTVVEVPLQRSVVYSMVHTSAIDELGRADAVAGVADAAYFAPDDPMKARLDDGRVADIGSSMSPSVEKIISLSPDAILLSPMEGAEPGAVAKAGIPIIYMSDYLEPDPLARAEWLRLIGLLYGNPEGADSIFAGVKADYRRLSAKADSCATRPTVITERPYAGVWYMPGGASYKARMLADAGAAFPWADEPSTGSQQLAEEAVMARAAGADFWLLNEMGDTDAARLEADMPHARAFAAFPAGVYVCNTLTTPMFRDIAFHPERVLADMVHIFHPELQPGYRLRYYRQLK